MFNVTAKGYGVASCRCWDRANLFIVASKRALLNASLTQKADICAYPEKRSRQTDIIYLHDPSFLQTAKKVYGAGHLRSQTRRRPRRLSHWRSHHAPYGQARSG